MTQSIHILLIEDSEDDMLLILREIKLGGYDVDYLRVETSEETQAALTEGTWDIIISDYNLPTFSAPEALKLLDSMSTDLPFIVVSGAVGEETAAELMKRGAGDYINKDNLSRLCPAIKRELEEAQTRKSQEKSQALSERLWDILNNSLNEVYVFDSKTLCFRTINHAGLDNLGFSMDELEALHPYDIMPDYDEARFSKTISPLISGEENLLCFEASHERKDGTVYPIEIRIQLTHTSTQNDYFAIVLDISERVKANAEIKTLAKFPKENPEPVIRIAIDGSLIYANPASKDVVNFWKTLNQQGCPSHWIEHINFCMKKDKTYRFEEQVGSKIYNWLLSPAPHKKEINCYGRDISQQKAAEQSLKQAGQVFDNSIEGIVITDSENNIIRINPAFSTITGYQEEEAIGQNPRLLKSDRHDDEFFKSMWEEISTNGIWQGEIWNKRKNGEEFPEFLTINAITDENEKVVNYISIFADITERKEAQENIHRLAYYDSLTGLPNRFHIQDKLLVELEKAEQSRSPLAVLHIDLRRFKVINETLGHKIADLSLEYIAQRFAEVIPSNAFIGRMEGDEFLVIVSNRILTDKDSPIIRDIFRVLEKPLTIKGQDIYLTVSMGIANYPEHGDSVEKLIRSAASASSYAKKEDAPVKTYSNEMVNSGLNSISMESGLRKAMEREEFVLHYQPQIDLKTGLVIGVEALLRWDHPEKGLVPPLNFIPLLEETGLIIPVGDWIIQKACLQIDEWKTLGIKPPRIALNLSAKQFNDKNLVVRIRQIMDKIGIENELIELEVTESIIMQRFDQVITILNELHESGIQISIDDFGTGYSSLSYLKHFPIDVLKIDQSFVKEIPHNNDDTAIVNTIISMGHNLNLSVIAEGVETEAQADSLKNMGCELAQGYFYSKPLPAIECIEVIRKFNKF